MSGQRLAWCWAAGCGALALGQWGGSGSRVGASALGLVGLALLAVLCTPGLRRPSAAAAGTSVEAPRRELWSSVAAAVVLAPLLALAVRLDLVRGIPPRSLLPAGLGLGAALWLIASLGTAAGDGARRWCGHCCYGALVLVALPAAQLAFDWAARPRSTPPPSWLDPTVQLSPLVWTYRWAEPGALGRAPPGVPWSALILVGALSLFLRRAGAPGRGSRGAISVGGALLLLGTGAATAPAAETRVALAQIELEGPLTAVSAELAGGGRAHFVVGLGAGERRTVELPLPIAGALARDLGGAPLLEAEGGGAARFAGWLPANVLGDELSRVPAGVRARPRPQAASRAGGLEPGVFPGLAALALVTFALARGGRARRLAALGLNLVAAGAVALWAFGVRAAEPGTARHWELDFGSRAALGLEITVSRGALDFAPGRFETDPAGLPLEVEGEVPDSGPPRAQVRAVGGSLQHLVALERPTLALSLGLDPQATDDELLAALARAFDPARVPGDGREPELPAWLVGGLPQGSRGVVAGPDGAGRWVRWTSL
jgi:hypothetical protein